MRLHHAVNAVGEAEGRLKAKDDDGNRLFLADSRDVEAVVRRQIQQARADDPTAWEAYDREQRAVEKLDIGARVMTPDGPGEVLRKFPRSWHVMVDGVGRRTLPPGALKPIEGAKPDATPAPSPSPAPSPAPSAPPAPAAGAPAAAQPPGSGGDGGTDAAAGPVAGDAEDSAKRALSEARAALPKGYLIGDDGKSLRVLFGGPGGRVVVAGLSRVTGAAEALRLAKLDAEKLAAAPAPSTDDDLYEKAVALVTGPDGKGSISLVQRHLAIGYNKAAGFLERMEREGIVGPMNDKGQRPVLKKAKTQRERADERNAKADAVAKKFGMKRSDYATTVSSVTLPNGYTIELQDTFDSKNREHFSVTHAAPELSSDTFEEHQSFDSIEAAEAYIRSIFERYAAAAPEQPEKAAQSAQTAAEKPAESSAEAVWTRSTEMERRALVGRTKAGAKQLERVPRTAWADLSPAWQRAIERVINQGESDGVRGTVRDGGEAAQGRVEEVAARDEDRGSADEGAAGQRRDGGPGADVVHGQPDQGQEDQSAQVAPDRRAPDRRWNDAAPAHRRDMLKAVGYVDADHMRVLSGFQWHELTDTVRRKLDGRATDGDRQMANAEPASDKKRPSAQSAERKLRQAWPVDGIDGYTEMPGQTPQQTDAGIKNGVKDAFLQDARAYLRAVAGQLQEYGFRRRQDAKGRDIVPVQINEGGPAVAGDVYLDMRGPTDASGDVRIQVGVSFNEPNRARILLQRLRGNSFVGGNQFPSSSMTAGELSDLIARQWGIKEKTDATATEQEGAAAPAAARAEQPPAAGATGAPAGAAAGMEAAGVKPEPAAAAPKAKPEPSKNTIVTDDMAAAARARLKAKLGRLGSGIDPEMLLDGVTLAAYHVERGARAFAAYARAMLDDLGESARPFLKSWYMGAKYDPRYAAIAEGMSSAAFVDEFDISSVAAPAPSADTGEDHGSTQARDLDRAGKAEPAGEPAADVRAPAGQRDAGDVADGGRGRAEPRDADAAAAGGDVVGGLGAGQSGAVPAGRAGRDGSGDAGQRGLPGAPRADSGAEQPADAGREGGVGPASPAPNAAPVPAPQLTPEQLADFTIEDDFALGEGGAKTKYRANVAAIRLAKEFMADPARVATQDEQKILARYVGWGGLAQAFDASNADWSREFAELKALMEPEEYEAARRSTRYAHYTSREVIGGIYGALRRFGFTGGRVLEPGAGVGNFLGLMPAEMRTAGRITAIEREPLAFTIAHALYPNQNVQHADYTEWKGADGFFDAVVGNPPFASDPQTDASGRKHLNGLSLHNYFFAKSVDMLREGGILAQVVTNSFLDATGDKARKYIAERTKFLGAIRLPNNAFSKNAGTEVTTDIIFLQKLPESQWGSKAAKEDAKRWMDVRPYQGKTGDEVNLNVYFHDNPQMMLGDFGAFGTMYRKGSSALVAREGQDTAALFKAAIEQLPEGIYKSIAHTGSDDATERAVIALERPPVQEGGYFLQGDKLIQRIEDLAGETRGVEITPETQWTEKTKLGERRFGQIKQLATLRQTLRDLLAAELKDAPNMDALRAQLNAQYDAYTKEHGLLGDRTTYAVLDDDPDFPLLLSLEDKYVAGIGPAEAKRLGIKPTKSTAQKAAIFTRRVVENRKPVARVENPKDALNVSMAERGRLDTAYIGELLGRDADEALRSMLQADEPLLFVDPATGEYVLRDAYLSGNVRAKLEQARAAGMEVNARELEKVQPEDVPAHQIAAKIGAPWVPTAVYEDFAKDLFGEGTNASIRYTKLNSSYAVYIKAGSEVNASNKWGIPAFDGPELLTAMLNNRTIKVAYKDADGKTVTDVEKTELANQKAQEIKDRFNDWLFSDADRAELLVRAYNDANNNYVTRKYDGSWMTFPGKVPDGVLRFRRHQRNAIARTVQERTALYDHVVGAGKTMTVVASAMELRRTGLAKKPMIAVPNHLVKQWAAEFYRLYPGANILTATKKDFERINRRRFLAKVATGDWDAVIIAHSSFGFIQPGADFEADFNQKQIELIVAAIKETESSDGDEKAIKRTVKQLEGMKERLENRIKRLRNKPMDALLDFEELGVDQLFVDEAHLFKNLMYQTKLQNVAGLGDPAGSKRAYDMYVKTQEVMAKNGRGQGVVFATGTPVSNSLAEKYHMMRFLMPRQMEELGFQSFDAWANTYADVRQHWMQKVSGDGFKAQNRMSEFVNVHELLRLFDQVADTVTNDDIKAAEKEEGREYPLPPVKGGKPRQPVSLDKSPKQSAYMEDLARRAAIVEARKGPPKKGEDNHLSLMTDARKAAMDIRLVDLDATEREKGGRIDQAADRIAERYKQWSHVKGTQLVFSDLGTPKKHAEKELKEYQRLQAIIAEATDEITDRAALGDERAQEIVDAAEDAQKELDEQGQDWLDAVKAALRGFSVYDDLKDALIERGVPEAEIAFIHDYNTDEQKAGLFRKVNSGQIRVLMGSTPKMGAGTNVQERLVALHHLDVPWKPSDVEQREGRIVRQGNVLLKHANNPGGIEGFEVEVLAYVTKDTLDMRMWQIQEVKLKIIHQLRTRQIERNIDNAFEDMEMSASEMQAAATGNMDLLYEIQARNDIKKLENKRRSFEAQKNDLIARRKKVANDLQRLPKEIEREEQLLKLGEAYEAALNEAAGRFKVTIDGTEYTSAEEAGKYLLSLLDKKQFVRTVEKDGKKIRQELSPEEYEKLGQRIVDLRGEGKPDDDPALAAAITERTSWTERAAPLDVTMNGEQYTARAKLTEAFSNIRGDKFPILYRVGEAEFNRRTAAAGAIRQQVADAIADEREQQVGTVGPWTVRIEGQPKDKFGRYTLDVWMTAGDVKREGYIILTDGAVNEDKSTINAQQAAEKVVEWAGANATGSAYQLSYKKHELERAKKTDAELKAADEMGEWPDQDKLEAARKKHQEILGRLAKSKAAPQPAAGQKPAFSQDPFFQGPDAAGRRKVGELQQAMDSIADEWARKVPVQVVSSVASPSVPPEIRAEAAARLRRGGGTPKGTIHDGVVWLFADAMRDTQDAAIVLHHEVLGHYGLRGHFGAGFDAVLNQVELLRREDVRAMIERTGMDPADPASRKSAAEEVLAYLAQTKPELTLVQRAIAAIRTWLRETFGGIFGDMQMSDEELIRNFILPARRFVEGGGPGPRGGMDFAQGEASKPFYSALTRAMEAVPAKALPVAGWTGAIQAQINKGAVKADEVEWSGIREWLQLQGEGKVAKQDVLDFLQANGVRVEEVIHGGSGRDATSELDSLIVQADALGFTFNRELFDEGDDYNGRDVQFTRRSDGKSFDLYGGRRRRSLVENTAASATGKPEEIAEGPIFDIATKIAGLADDERDGIDEDGTRYSSYTLPGGENYRELLLTLPTETYVYRGPDKAAAYAAGEAAKARGLNFSVDGPSFDGTNQDYLTTAFSGEREQYTSNHWSERNIVAHIRMDDRTDAEGKRVLFIEELQSDWAQQGRREGFTGDMIPQNTEWVAVDTIVEGLADRESAEAELRRMRRDGERWAEAALREGQESRLVVVQRGGDWRVEQEMRSIEAMAPNKGGVPRAPFVDKTDAWLGLALKRIVKYAVDGGYDRVAFVNGQQSADRYDLSQQVDNISYEKTAKGYFLNVIGTNGANVLSKDMTPKEVEDTVGKEILAKMERQEGAHEGERDPGLEGTYTLRGLDLKVGGEGMLAFYDKIVPTALGKLLPKIGGGMYLSFDGKGKGSGYLGDVVFENPKPGYARDSDEPAQLYQPGFDVTDEMRAAAANGLPLFAQGAGRPEMVVRAGRVFDELLEQFRMTAHADGSFLSQLRVPATALSSEVRALIGPQLHLQLRDDDVLTLRYRDGSDDRIHVTLAAPGASATPMFSQDIDMSVKGVRTYARAAFRELADGTPGKLHWWHKSIGTQYNLAKRNALFARVFWRVQDFLEDVSRFATEAADLAPSILPKLDSWRDILPKVMGGSGKKPLSVADNRAIEAPIFEGTLEWARDKYGNPIRIDDLKAQAKLMTAEEKLQFMLRMDVINPLEVERRTRPFDGDKTEAAKPKKMLDEKTAQMWRGLPFEQFEAMVNTRFENMALKAGVVWTRTELTNLFGLDKRQQDLYFEFRASVNESITRAALSDMVRYVGKNADFIREEVMTAADVKDGADMLMKQLEELAKSDEAVAASLAKTRETLEEKAKKALELQDRGYAPLMRFGHYTVTVYGENEDSGEEEVKFFRMYESAAQARIAAERMAVEMDDIAGLRIERGTLNEEEYKLFQGINPETVELFGEMLGMSELGDSAADLAFQAYLKLARNNRSAMKRMIHRKGTAGYSEDVGRVLAGFTFSTARLTSRNLHAGQIAEAVRDIKLKDKNQGELARQATRLMEYVNNPGEEAQALRGLLFAQYLGGSVAAALVNALQPFQVTMPYLSQFGGVKKSVARMRFALANAWAKTTGDTRLDRDLQRAVEEGIVAPQEIHQLMAQSQGKGGLIAGDGTRVGNTFAAGWNFAQRLSAAWGKPFSTAELFNRRVTFVAAYRTAQEEGKGNPFEFAKQAVIDTQFLYCVDEETEALTLDGWKRRSDLREGDILIGVDEAGRAIETPLLDVHHFPGKQKATAFSNATKFSMIVTDAHDCLIQSYNSRDKKWQGVRKVKAAKLAGHHNLLRAPLAAIERDEGDTDFAALLGWVAAEGHYAKFRNCKDARNVRITQSNKHNPEYVAEIEALLQRLGGHYRRFADRNGEFSIFTLRKPLSDRVLAAMPKKLLTWRMVKLMSASEMRALLDAFAKGDGTIGTTGGWVIAQKAESNLQVLQAMSLMVGKTATLYPGPNPDAGRIAHLYLHKNTKRTLVKQLRRERVEVDGVWCPETLAGTWIARRNGAVFVTGNSKANRPEWARGALGATLMTFKQYSISYLELVSRMWNVGEPGSPERAAGRRAVFFAAFMMLFMAGAGGFPFVEDVEDAVDGLMQRLGYNWSSKQKKRELLENVFGKAFGSFLEKGISGVAGVPIDVSGRLGMGNLIPGTGVLQKKRDHGQDILEVAGPTGDLFKRAGAALGAAADGNLVEAGRQAVPKAMRDVAKGVEMLTTGQFRDSRGRKVIDATTTDALAQAIGFRPSAVAAASEADRAAQVMVEQARLRESEIAAKWARGIADRDQGVQQEARRELAAWNEKNPSTPIRIKLADVLRRAVKMNQTRSQRIEASSPREVREEARRIMRSQE